VAASDDDFVNRPRNAIFRGELPLLYCAFHEHVLSLLVGDGQFGELIVKRQAVPVCMRLDLAILALMPVALAKPRVGHLCPGR